jgi:hypothetical protein
MTIKTKQQNEENISDQHVDYVYGDVCDGEISETELELMSTEIPLKYLVVCKYLVEIKKVTEDVAKSRVLNLFKLSGDNISIHMGTLKRSLKEPQVPLVRGFTFTENMEFVVDIRKEDVLKVFNNHSVLNTDKVFDDGVMNYLDFVDLVSSLQSVDKKAEELTKESQKRTSELM